MDAKYFSRRISLPGRTIAAVCLAWTSVGVGSGVPAASTTAAHGCVPTYHDSEEFLGDAVGIELSDRQPAEVPTGRVEEFMSPDGGGRLSIHTFDSMKAGAGRIVVAIRARGTAASYLSFDPARGVNARWLNERLVFIQAWWGRIAASDIVFDALKKRFLYRKLAHHAFILDPECAELENPSHSPRNEG